MKFKLFTKQHKYYWDLGDDARFLNANKIKIEGIENKIVNCEELGVFNDVTIWSCDCSKVRFWMFAKKYAYKIMEYEGVTTLYR